MFGAQKPRKRYLTRERLMHVMGSPTATGIADMQGTLNSER
jgi:hypothetical protein